MCVCVCVCVCARAKLPPSDLNPGSYPPYLTNTYNCGVTITPRVCSGRIRLCLDELAFVYVTHIYT